MNDAEGLAMFKPMATQFGNELRRFGLVVVPELSPEKTDIGPGWMAKVATWRRNRPNISVWLDRALGEERQVWIPFSERRCFGRVYETDAAEIPRLCVHRR